MRETDEQIVDVAFALRELDADSIPVNFLHADRRDAARGRTTSSTRAAASRCSASSASCARRKEIRVSGGREVNLRSLQPLSLYPANAIFIGDYLTTSGQTAADDYRMIEDLGFEIEECAL